MPLGPLDGHTLPASRSRIPRPRLVEPYAPVVQQLKLGDTVAGGGRAVNVELRVAEVDGVAGPGAYEKAASDRSPLVGRCDQTVFVCVANAVSVVVTPPPESGTAKTRPSREGTLPTQGLCSRHAAANDREHFTDPPCGPVGSGTVRDYRAVRLLRRSRSGPRASFGARPHLRQ